LEKIIPRRCFYYDDEISEHELCMNYVTMSWTI
jgi:hypothetical protein